MASGDTLLIFRATDASPPATLNAVFDTVPGGSTPAEALPVLDFAAASSVYADFVGVMPQSYAGTTGVTLRLFWSSSAVAGGSDGVRWEAAFRAIEDDAEDINAAHTYVYNGETDLPPSAIGEVTAVSIPFTDGADMDSVAAGDMFILRVYRDHDHADDDMTGNAELHLVEIQET